jgi:hypothetical protein
MVLGHAYRLDPRQEHGQMLVPTSRRDLPGIAHAPVRNLRQGLRDKTSKAAGADGLCVEDFEPGQCSLPHGK